ncbi:MAG: heavy metal sensor histidine kinase, partial [Betaproteobacteria bacterium]|nr:heavy metal sensor histidine kinase [Betaproteobacteria bacterium]
IQSKGNHLPLPPSVGLPNVATLDSGGMAFRVLTQPLPNGFMLQIGIASPGSQALLLRYRETLTLVLAVSIILCAVLGYLIARSGMHPIERIAETAENIRLSTLHERLDVAGLPGELAALANTGNLRLDRLEQSFLQLSQFSADLAHELRTPISNLRGELEVALSRPRSDDTYREVLGSALEECTRISRVIQSLLFLARAEMVGAPPAVEALDLATEIATVLEFYQPMAAEAGLSLTARVRPGLPIRFDRILLQQALGNLVANAIAHTGTGGQITIEVAEVLEQLSIRIKDTGQGIAPEHLPHVFDRFYRADPARSHVGGNLGLGLAVVRAIMDLHGGRVSIESTQGQGTTVSLLVAATAR